MVSSVQIEPVSRTDQYKRVMKPLLERKRRARINRCLDELRDLLVAALQAEGETVTRLEKADILELTVRHVRRLNQRRRLVPPPDGAPQQDPRQDAFKFQQGFMAAAQQVQSFLMSTSSVEPSASSRLMVHLTSCASALANPNANSHSSPPPPYTKQDPAASTHSIQRKPLATVSSVQHEIVATLPHQMIAMQPTPPLPSAPVVHPPKCSPPLSPPPLIDLSMKASNGHSSSYHQSSVSVITPTPIRRTSPLIFKDSSLPEDLSIRKDISREDPQDSKDAWRPW